jgi:hypothetical protein
LNENFITRVDKPVLLLQPGKADPQYDIAQYGFNVLKGEVIRAVGQTTVNGTGWLLLSFSTSDQFGDGGVGARYAWGRADDFVAVSGYAPDNSRVDPAWLSSGLRLPGSRPSEPPADYLPPTQPAALPERLKSNILKNGFWIDPTIIYPSKIDVDDMADLYALTNEGSADFISVDLFLHSYHIIFDRMLQSLEKSYFSPRLAANMKLALAELEKFKPGLTSPQAQQAYETVKDMFTVPLALLGDRTVRYSNRAQVEIDRILSASEITNSTITNLKEDYTQYRPRGHYTLSPELERYFRAMSFLGNAGLSLFQSDGSPNLDSLRKIVLIVFAINAHEAEWKSFEGPINYLIGSPDDAGYAVYFKYVSEIVGEVKNIADDGRLRRLADEIKIKVPQAAISYVIQGSPQERTPDVQLEFRLSGKRFTFDSFVLDSLTSPGVGTQEIPRYMPMGTDVMSALGSSAADEISLKNDYIPRYTKTLNRLKQIALVINQLYPNFYTSWLMVIKDGFSDSGSRQFFYRATGPWKWKKLMTAHASWAELRHDTLLYVKQSGAELGDGVLLAGDFAPPRPRGYVEPDPQVFAALTVSVDRLLDLFKFYTLESGDLKVFTEKLNTFRGLCQKALQIAQREVAEETLSQGEYDTIKELAKSFDTFLLLDEYGETDPSDVNSWRKLSMAIIADVHTDFFDEKIMYVATGTPRRMYVFVNDRSGGPRLTVGYVYSYYEYSYPLSVPRLTDETWRDVVYDPGKAGVLEKIHPPWYSQLYN